MVSLKNRSRSSTGNGSARIPDAAALAVQIPKLLYQTIEITVEGISPLICHAWGSKAIKMMLGKQMGEPSPGREKKDPLQDFKDSLYYLPDNAGLGLPAPSFKAAIVTGANEVEMKMTEIKRTIHVSSYTVPIIAPPLDKSMWTDWDHKYEKDLEKWHNWGCSMRMDLVRLQTGVADIRFRGSFPVWKCKLAVEFNSRSLTAEQVVNLVQSAGKGCGVGEWRPSAPECRSGEFGRFAVCN